MLKCSSGSAAAVVVDVDDDLGHSELLGAVPAPEDEVPAGDRAGIAGQVMLVRVDSGQQGALTEGVVGRGPEAVGLVEADQTLQAVVGVG